MNSLEHTDPDGDALTITRDKGLAWITITRDGDELTVGPIPGNALDDTDGGVTAALIEKEAAESCPEDCDFRVAHGRLVKTYRETLSRAEKAEQERDEAREAASSANHAMQEVRARLISPDGISEEMVERAKAELEARAGGDYYPETLEAVLTAALTEPPQRPEAVEDIVALLDDYGMDDFEERDLLAEWLAKHGVRVVNEEQP